MITLMTPLLRSSLLLSALWVASPQVSAQLIQQELFETANALQVLAQPDGGVLVLSDAGFVNGAPTGNVSGVLGLAVDGSVQPVWSQSLSSVLAMARDPMDATVLVGGTFETVNAAGGTQARARIARFSADGTLLPWSIAPDAGETPLTRVERIVALANGDLVFIDQPAFEPARVCRAPGGEAVFRCVHEIIGGIRVLQALPDGGVLLGGTLLQLGDTAVPPLVRLQAQTLALDGSFSYSGSGEVTAAAVDGGGLWVASGTQLQRLNSNGSSSGTPAVQANGSINTLQADGTGGVFAGGSFSLIADAERARLARLSASGAADPLWVGPDITGSVRDMALLNDRLVAVGVLNSREARAAALISLSPVDGSPTTQAAIRLGNAVRASALFATATADGGAVFAGAFSHNADEILLPGVLKVDAAGAPVPGWAPVLPGVVSGLLGGPDGFVYVVLRTGAGPLTWQYSLRRLAIADAALDSGWQFSLGSSNPTALMINAGHLWIGYVDGSMGNRSRLLRVSLGEQAMLDPEWASQAEVNGIARALIALADGSVLMLPVPAGSGVIFNPPPPIPPAPRLARFVRDSAGVQALPFGPTFDSGAVVSDVALMSDGRLLLMELNGSGTSGLRRLAADGTLDAGFSADQGALQPRGAIALDEARGHLYVAAGRLPEDGFPPYIPTLARLQLASASLDPGWPAPELQPEVDVRLSVQGERVFASALNLSPSQPLGAFISTSVPPLFVNGFEGD
jgi:hypothetical protein